MPHMRDIRDVHARNQLENILSRLAKSTVEVLGVCDDSLMMERLEWLQSRETSTFSIECILRRQILPLLAVNDITRLLCFICRLFLSRQKIVCSPVLKDRLFFIHVVLQNGIEKENLLSFFKSSRTLLDLEDVFIASSLKSCM